MNDESLRHAFGVRFREKRKSMGLSQRKLGNILGLHQNHIGRYERGAAWPSVPMLITLSRVFETPMDRLVLGEPTPDTSSTDNALPDVGQARVMALAERVGALPASDQLVVISLIEAFLLKVKVVEMTRG